MTLLARHLVEQRFREVESRLDAAVALSKTRLEEAHVAVRDDSHRSGSDKTGYPCFVWSFSFFRERRFGVLVELVAVDVSYTQPIESESEPLVELRRRTERFSIGNFGPRRITTTTTPLASSARRVSHSPSQP